MINYINPEKLDEIERRAKAAREAPWDVKADHHDLFIVTVNTDPAGMYICKMIAPTQDQGKHIGDDADFIAHSRQDVIDLCAALIEARKINAELASEIFGL